MKTTSAFTLIELLVVITIIVVLLALLTPAMDKAIYEAELAVCSAHQRTIAMSTLHYAMDHKRRYPHQPACDQPDSYWQAVSLYYHQGPAAPTNSWDQRPLLRPYMDINKLFNDPLVTPVVLDNTLDDATGSPNDATVDVVATMGLWAGFRYLGWQGMLKIGDRLEHRYGGGVVKFYEVMVSDRDSPGGPMGQPKVQNDAIGWARQGTLKLAGAKGSGQQASHPDDKGLLENVPIQDGSHPWGGVNIGVTISYWLNLDSWARRGKIDSNYAFQDLSVNRYRGVTPDDDERMADVWTFSHRGGAAQQFPVN